MTQLTTLHHRRELVQREWARLVPEMRELRRPFGPMELRREIAGSWVRSLRTVDPDRREAPRCEQGSIERRWENSPLRRPVEEMVDLLGGVADAGFVVALADDSATILWSISGRLMRQRAEAVNFGPGGRWDEQAVGTNAIALAMQTGRAATVFAAEHLTVVLHEWVSYAAPIRSPSGRLLGVVAIATTWDRANVLGLSTVCATATGIEARLKGRRAQIEFPAAQPETESDRSTGLVMSCLGQARTTFHGRPMHLTPRQLEILTLLALQPSGYSPSSLAAELYGDRPVADSTLKAEISHLRRLVDGELTPRHYALTMPVSCDAASVMAALEQGDLSSALRSYRGPLLPDSDAPGITAWRDRIDVALRSAVLASPRPEHALSYGTRHPDDLQVHEHALRHLGRGDRRRPIAAARRYAAMQSTY